MTTFISKDDRLAIDELTTDAADVARRKSDDIPKTRKTSVLYNCPACSAKDGLEIVTHGKKKGVFKCFHCEKSGAGGSKLLQVMYGMDWKSAYSWLATEYKFEIKKPAKTIKEANKQITEGKVTFRDLQLSASGIPNDAQLCPVPLGNGQMKEINRYSPGTLNESGDFTAAGNDMVLHYMGLDCQPILFKPKKGKEKPLIRVRYQHPDLHTDRDGKPVKYRSQYDSGNHLWLPMHIIKAYQTSRKIKTLFVVEGEKKSDKMCLHGMDTVGLAGIHNLAFNTEMPRVFELLITRCEIEEVVFVLDSDWKDINATPGRGIDMRPRTFMRAVQKFREYFYGYRNSGIDLRIFMCAGKDQDKKGMDDLLLDLEFQKLETLRQPGALAADISAAIADPQGAGQYVQAWNIHPLRVSEYQLSEKWFLDDSSKFFEHHFEALKGLGEFKFGKITYFFNADTQKIEMAQQILPAETFWDMEEFQRGGRWVKEVKFNYDRIRKFLFNRGIGLYEYSAGLYRTVRREAHLMMDVTPQWIQRYVVEFAENAAPKEHRDDVVQMLLRGNTQFLGPNNLNYMYQHNPDFIAPSPDQQIMVFRNCFWIITPEKIEQRPLTELQGTIWQNQIINFEPEYIGHPMVTMKKDQDGWHLNEAPECNGKEMCELYDYVRCTSMFAWEKVYELVRDEDHILKYFVREEPQPMNAAELAIWKMHIATKLIAWGYKLRHYRDESNKRAIICMDGLESAVGRSQGGSGKSIFAMATGHCQPIFTVDGKTADLKNDKFLYHGVDERTREIVFDDVRVNFDFELLFSQITQFIRVKPFQGAPITIPSPIFTITTNHSINGDTNAFKRRQYFLGFSNFFNEHRTPAHYFGHQLFTDWTHKQWNLYYNLMATCIQLYMQYSDLGRYAVESSDIDRRRLRQQIGEDFLDFADTYFTESYMLNRIVDKTRILEDFLEQYPNERRFMDAKKIKTKTEMYAKYAGYDYNPIAGPDGRIKSSGTEFCLVADANFNAKDPGEKVFKDTRIEPKAVF